MVEERRCHRCPCSKQQADLQLSGREERGWELKEEEISEVLKGEGAQHSVVEKEGISQGEWE